MLVWLMSEANKRTAKIRKRRTNNTNLKKDARKVSNEIYICLYTWLGHKYHNNIETFDKTNGQGYIFMGVFSSNNIDWQQPEGGTPKPCEYVKDRSDRANERALRFIDNHLQFINFYCVFKSNVVWCSASAEEISSLCNVLLIFSAAIMPHIRNRWKELLFASVRWYNLESLITHIRSTNAHAHEAITAIEYRGSVLFGGTMIVVHNSYFMIGTTQKLSHIVWLSHWFHFLLRSLARPQSILVAGKLSTKSMGERNENVTYFGIAFDIGNDLFYSQSMGIFLVCSLCVFHFLFFTHFPLLNCYKMIVVVNRRSSNMVVLCRLIAAQLRNIFSNHCIPFGRYIDGYCVCAYAGQSGFY